MNLFPVRALLLLLVLVTSFSFAEVPSWNVVPNESTITFTATQNNAPVSGKFNSFSANINFDPAQLDASQVRVVVDMNSVTASYNEVATTLKSSSWFDVEKFPRGEFSASKFTKTGDNTYRADGVLTLRDKRLPATLDFTILDYSPTQFHAKGKTTIKRTAYGIGQGHWANTDEVKDDVQVEFTLSAVKK